MKENIYDKKIYNLDKELQNEIELKKILHSIYLSNLEENINLLLNNQKTFYNDLVKKINYCLEIQFSSNFFEMKKSIRINDEFNANFKEAIFDPLEKFIFNEIKKSKDYVDRKKYSMIKSNEL